MDELGRNCRVQVEYSVDNWSITELFVQLGGVTCKGMEATGFRFIRSSLLLHKSDSANPLPHRLISRLDLNLRLVCNTNL